MITYTKIKEFPELWGIDVLVIFHDDSDNQDISRTFNFKDSEDILLNFESRMALTIPKIEEEKLRDSE